MEEFNQTQSFPNGNNQFTKDLQRSVKIKKNAMLFIMERKLVKYDLKGKTFLEKHLPTDISLGTTYAIKNNTIFEFWSGMTTEELPEDPKHLEYAMYKSRPLTLHHKMVVTVHNLNIGDLGGFANANQFIGMNELVSYDLQKTTIVH